jgi:AbrB family looped-hinge helix DNA binding protein
MFYHVTLDSNGRISIPKNMRRQINLQTGDGLVLSLVGNEIHINTIEKKINDARDLVKKYCTNINLVEDLLLMRKEEVKRDG